MNGNFVVLILGVLVLAYAVYFTHTILRARVARGGSSDSAGFQVDANARNQVADEVKAAGENRSLSTTRLGADVDQARRVFAGAPKLHPGRCLWVDHDPDAIVHERRMVELLRVEIDLVRTTNQALQFLVGRRYDFIVTDLTRPVAGGGVDDRAGIKLLKMLAGAPTVPPVIVYADRLAGDDDDEPEAEAEDDDAQTAASPPAEAPSDDAVPSDDEAPSDDEGADHDADADDDADGDDAAMAADEPVEDEVADPRLDDARTAGARAAVTTPAALLTSVLDVLATG